MKIKYMDFLNSCTPYEDGCKKWRSDYNTEFFKNFFSTVYDYADKVILVKPIWFKKNKMNKAVYPQLTIYENGNFEIKCKIISRAKKIDEELVQEYVDIYSNYIMDLFNEMHKLDLFY